MDTLSDGKLCLFHFAAVDSSVNNLTGSITGDIGILFVVKYLVKSYFIIKSLNDLLNGPAYETKADAIKTSPTMTFNCSSRTTIEFAHLSF